MQPTSPNVDKLVGFATLHPPYLLLKQAELELNEFLKLL